MELLRGRQSEVPTAPAGALGKRSSEVRWNLLCVFAVLMSAAFELGLRETFYHVSSEAPGLLLLTIFALITAAVGLSSSRTRDDTRAQLVVSRVLTVLSVFLWWRFGGIGWGWVATWWWALLLVSCFGAVKSFAPLWARLRRAVTAAVMIFVLSQPALALWRASPVQWLPHASPTAGEGQGADSPSAETTVVVLLDELSAKAAGPIAEAMARSGSPVMRRAIASSGDATAKVVPSLLLRREFREAKPCSWHTVCSDTDALDVGRVTVGRPDVDVVGFYFPYCAIMGLRSCNVVSPISPYLDFARWHCAAQRRSDWLTGLDGETERVRCANQLAHVWATLGKDVEAAIWRAPVWERGGVLYAHVPLPHPPGDGGEGSLDTHYRANIAKSARLIGAVAERLAGSGRPFSLVVFSDHPLRAIWCQSMQYRDSCPPSADLLDDHVPLLATGVVSPAFATIKSNMEIFSLVGNGH
jgi:hypothetical protein